MKKVLSFVLVLSMILGSFGMAFAAPADVVGKDCEDAVNVLTELGVIAGYKDGSFKPENVVTRAEMATFIIKAMGLEEYAVAKSSFSDMAGHWADPFVAYAASLNIIAGYADGTFKPDQTVSYDQAITMLVQALGYQGKYLVGGFPGAFVNQAKALGMLDGVKVGGEGANRGDVAVLLNNTLRVDFVRYDVNGLEQPVDDNMMARLTGGVAPETRVITGAEDSLINIKGYQGAYAKVLWNDDLEIVAVDEVKSVFLTGTVETSVSTSALTSGAVKFIVDEVEYTIADDANVISPAAVEFLNGKVGAVNELVADEEYVIAAKVSGKKIKEFYSIAAWSGAEFVWDVDSHVDELADAKTLNAGDATFKQNDNDEIDTDSFVLVGVDTLADIKDHNIVTYYTGYDAEDAAQRITKVEVGTKTIEGKVTKEASNGDVTIGGKVYEVVGGAASLGDEGTFYFNYAGKIVDFEGVSETKNYAVVVKQAAVDTADGYDDEDINKIKLYTAAGKEVVFVLKDAAYNTVSGAATGSVISYVLNADGEIKTAAVEAAPSNNGVTMTAKGYLDGVKVAADVLVFNAESVTEYAIGAKNNVATNETLNNTYYVVDENEVVVIVYGHSATADGVYGMVKEWAKIKDADDEDVMEVVLLIDGAEKTYICDDTNFTAEKTSFYAFSFTDGKLDVSLELTSGAMTTSGAVAAKQDGNIKLDGNTTYEDVAADVVVYFVDADGKCSISSFDKIGKTDLVEMFNLDESADDKDGYDVIIFQEV